MKIDVFSSGLIAMVMLGLWWTESAAWGDGQYLHYLTKWGVCLIFFLYGLKLKVPEMLAGLRKWKLHVSVQACTFILFPLVLLPWLLVFESNEPTSFWFSLYFLACLPSTVSSAVVMVSMAKGDVPSAIFNASISGIIGIFLTPLLLSPFFEQSSDLSIGPIYGTLLLEIVLPLSLGLLLSNYWGAWVRQRSRWLHWFDRVIILLIVYKSFANSTLQGQFNDIDGGYLAGITLAVFLLFVVVFVLSGWMGRNLGFNQAEQITLQYCGSKKSLIHGSVFAQALFGGQAALGLLLLPVLIYHGLQIILVSMLSQRAAQK